MSGMLCDVPVTREGFVCGGASIGTVDYMTKHVQRHMVASRDKLDALRRYGRDQPQAAFALLEACVLTATTHLLRTTPPAVTIVPAEALDRHVQALRMDLLGGVAADTCSQEREDRANRLAELPRAAGGLGHTPVAKLAPAAYLAGYAVASKFPSFAARRSAVAASVRHAHAVVVEQVGGPDAFRNAGEASADFATMLPTASAQMCVDVDVTGGVRAYDPNKNTAPTSQSIITAPIKRRMVEDFARSVDFRTASSEQGSTFTKADAMHFNIVLGRGTGDPEVEGSGNLPNRAMLLPLHYRTMRLEPHQFRANGRNFFGLPQLAPAAAARAADNGWDIDPSMRPRRSSKSDTLVYVCCNESCKKRLRQSRYPNLTSRTGPS